MVVFVQVQVAKLRHKPLVIRIKQRPRKIRDLFRIGK